MAADDWWLLADDGLLMMSCWWLVADGGSLMADGLWLIASDWLLFCYLMRDYLSTLGIVFFMITGDFAYMLVGWWWMADGADGCWLSDASNWSLLIFSWYWYRAEIASGLSFTCFAIVRFFYNKHYGIIVSLFQYNDLLISYIFIEACWHSQHMRS